jgi:predicted Zn-dependent protease
MKKFVALLSLTLSLAAEPARPAKEFEWPAMPVNVRLISIPVACSWKDGRPFVAREAVARLLKLEPEWGEEVDLGEALSQKNWNVQRQSDGSVVASPPVASNPEGPRRIRESDESKLAVRNFAAICAQEGVVWLRSHPRQTEVDQIGNQLAELARRPIPWTFAIVEDKDPNAACTGEGMVFITTGLLGMLDSDELAGILGHEIAHGVAQHLSSRRNENSRVDKTLADYDAAKSAYQEALKSGDAATIAAAKSRFEFKMRTIDERARAHLSFKEHGSRTNERQADLLGMRLAKEAGYRPDGLLRALEKLAAHNYSEYGLRALLGSQSHPPITERIKAQKALLEKESR